VNHDWKVYHPDSEIVSFATCRRCGMDAILDLRTMKSVKYPADPHIDMPCEILEVMKP